LSYGCERTRDDPNRQFAIRKTLAPECDSLCRTDSCKVNRNYFLSAARSSAYCAHAILWNSFASSRGSPYRSRPTGLTSVRAAKTTHAFR